MSPSHKIYVTQPDLPPLSEFVPFLEKIWESKRLTNAGPFHHQLERELESYLGVEHLSLFANGTLALVTALQALRVSGEVITTPFSFVATAHSLLWNNLKPVFVDIDKDSLTLDPHKIQQAITPQTTAILPVHVYGRPCAIDHIQDIASTYGLRVIYDAAHAFGVTCNDQSILRFGDLSILSFHATKVFSTFEGGAIISADARTKQRIDYLKNFGFADEITVVAPGINGKMNEVQAAFGLLQLKYIDGELSRRAAIDTLYRNALTGIEGLRVLPLPAGSRQNHGYFPVMVESGYPLSRDGLYEKLRARDIFARRYFYPLISQFPMYRGLASAAPSNLPVAHATAEHVLCLPIYPTLTESDVTRIVAVVRGN